MRLQHLGIFKIFKDSALLLGVPFHLLMAPTFSEVVPKGSSKTFGRFPRYLVMILHSNILSVHHSCLRVTDHLTSHLFLQSSQREWSANVRNFLGSLLPALLFCCLVTEKGSMGYLYCSTKVFILYPYFLINKI